MVDDATAGPIEQFNREHHTRYVLCTDEGREIMDVEPEHVELIAQQCARIGTGYIRPVHVPLNSIPQVWP